jgi:hypothetical protein
MSGNIITDTAGPAIDLFGDANASVQPPVITTATTSTIAGTATAGSRVEVYRATRPAGQSGLPEVFLGAATAAGNGTWSMATPGGVSSGQRVTALQIRTDNNTSELSANVALASATPVAPAITSAATTSFTEGDAGTFTITATGVPVPALSVTGALPGGVTFTDNGNGTGTLAGTPASGTAGTFPLTVTATNGVNPPANQAFSLVVVAASSVAEDAFGRTVANGWGTADAGGAWSVSGTASDWSVNGKGRVLVAAGNTRRAWLGGATAQDVEIVVEIDRDKVATGNGTYAYVVARRINANNEYRAKVRFTAAGTVEIQATRLVNGTESTIGGSVTVPGLTPAPGQAILVRARFTVTSPTTVSIRAWLAGGTEPATWQATGTDSTAALQAAGAVGVQVYASGSTTNAPILITFDNFRAIAQ